MMRWWWWWRRELEIVDRRNPILLLLLLPLWIGGVMVREAKGRDQGDGVRESPCQSTAEAEDRSTPFRASQGGPQNLSVTPTQHLQISVYIQLLPLPTNIQPLPLSHCPFAPAPAGAPVGNSLPPLPLTLIQSVLKFLVLVQSSALIFSSS